MKYIIMCGGTYEAWETPRQLTKINGEQIVMRTVRLLREAGARDIAISSNDMRFAAFGVPVLQHNNDLDVKKDRTSAGCWVSAFYPTDEPACYIMGDVVFSPDAINTIVNRKTNSIRFFASRPPFHPSYIKQWAEPFAFKVTDQKRFRAAIDYVKANINSGIFVRHPIAWELWQVINGEDPRRINFDNYTAINDYTCDVDRPEDAEQIERAMNYD
ncbi:MAG: hypothetical protein U0L10_08020 [Lachnospiraceae bacterium]|nr:hypothetical protein [Lachnospiraceae bacterium]